jgi:hypothetical protein
MTAAQRIHLMADLWPRACRCQGWNAKDRGLRLRVLSQAVGRVINSATALDETADYDAVKAHLGMLADSVAATIETDHPELGRARRLRVVIGHQLADLRAYHPNPPALLAGLVRDKFGSGYDLDDLTADPIVGTDRRTGRPRESASQLDQVMFTLARILSTKRKAAKAGADRLPTDPPF